MMTEDGVRMMSRVCAIVPTYNRANYLPIALESILRQTRMVDEIIIVNDGSTDNTLDILAPYHDRVTVITQPNAGKATAMNAALARTRADYIWIFDDDDIAAEDGIRPLVDALDANPELDFVYGAHQYFMDDQVEDLRYPDFWGEPGLDRALINFLGNLFPFQAAMLVRRETFDRIGHFRMDFPRCQDVEALIRLALYANSQYVPHIIFYQRVHGGARFLPGRQMTAGEALTRAVQFSQKALLLHRDEMTVDRVMPYFAANLRLDLKRRAAYLSRACMFARSALWQMAIADLTTAVRTSASPALAEELERAAVSINMAHMWDLLSLDRASVRKLARLRRSSPYGRSIVTALAKPMLWLTRSGFREGGFRLGWQRLRLLIKLIGVGGCCRMVMEKVSRRQPAVYQSNQVA